MTVDAKHLLPVAMLVVFVALIFGTEVPADESARIWLKTFVAALFAATGVAWWVTAFRKSKVSQTFASALVAATALLLVAAILRLGMIQFGGFDHSALIDMGWRLYNGQKPFGDFPCPMPPVFYLGAWLAFVVFGVSWWSLVMLAALFSGGTFVWGYFLWFRLTEDALLAWLLSFFLQVCTMVLVSYWWYNPVTTVVACLFFLSAQVFLAKPREVSARASFVLSLALLAMCKPNVAAPLAVAALAILTCTKLRVATLLLASAAALLVLFLLTIAGVDPLGVVDAYRAVAGRGMSLNQLFQDVSSGEKLLFSIVFGLLLLPWLVLSPKLVRIVRTPSFALSIFALVAGVWGFLTNGEAKLVDAPLIVYATFFGLCLACPASSGLLPRDVLSRCLILLICILVGLASGQALTRDRVKAIGPGAFFESQTVDSSGLPEFFSGLSAGQNLNVVASEVQRLVAEHGNVPIYFGPRMQWAYAAFGIDSPKGQPSWWHPGVSFDVRKEAFYESSLVETGFPIMVFLRDDFTYMSPNLLGRLSESYGVDPSFSTLTVLRRKR